MAQQKTALVMGATGGLGGEMARRLIVGSMLIKPENGTNEALDLLNRALSHGSARAAKMLAEIYRNGELDQAKDPLLAMKYAFLAIKLSVQADPARACPHLSQARAQARWIPARKFRAVFS